MPGRRRAVADAKARRKSKNDEIKGFQPGAAAPHRPKWGLNKITYQSRFPLIQSDAEHLGDLTTSTVTLNKYGIVSVGDYWKW